jgi:hypothetical protein
MCLFEPVNVNGQPTFVAKAMISEDACDQVIQAFNVLDPHQGVIAGGVDKSKKESYDISLPPNYVLRNYQTQLDEVVDCYRQYFRLDEFGPPMQIREHINIQFYPKGGGAYHKIHCDRGIVGDSPYREMVFMTYLNTVKEGGETQFMFQNLKFKPVKGLTLIFPTGWTHLHKGLSSSTDDKLIITGWISNAL